MNETIQPAGQWNSSLEEFRYDCNHLTNDSTVIDFGGYKGEFAFKIQEKYKCNVYVYEPINEYCDDMEKYKNPKVHINRFSVGSHTGTEEIAVEEGTTFEKYGRRKNNSHKGEPNKSIIEAPRRKIDVVDILSVMKNYDTVDLMKINIEGAEFDILPKLISSGEINKVENLQVQFHSFVEGAYDNYKLIKEQLSKDYDIVLDSLWKWTFWKRKDNA